MATALATQRTAILTALAGITTTQKYRRRMTNPQFPCHVVGWPDEYDVRPDQSGSTTATIPVWVGVEVGDDESADDQLSGLLDSTVTALLAVAAYDVQPATDFGETLTDDGRTVVWCRLPVVVFA